jgi:hypothetical protein
MSYVLPLSPRARFVSACGLTCLLMVVLAPRARGQEANTATRPTRLSGPLPTTRPGAKAGADAPLYVGAY